MPLVRLSSSTVLFSTYMYIAKFVGSSEYHISMATEVDTIEEQQAKADAVGEQQLKRTQSGSSKLKRTQSGNRSGSRNSRGAAVKLRTRD